MECRRKRMFVCENSALLKTKALYFSSEVWIARLYTVRTLHKNVYFFFCLHPDKEFFPFHAWFVIYSHLFLLSVVGSVWTSPGIWPRCHPMCPAADWVCLSDRWCRPSRHTGVCILWGRRRTLSCTLGARRQIWSLGTHCRRRMRRKRRGGFSISCNLVSVTQDPNALWLFRHRSITSHNCPWLSQTLGVSL